MTMLRDNKGFSVTEIMIVLLIFSIIIVGLYASLSTGQATWFNTETSMELQQTIRKTLQRVARELQESGFDKNNILQVSIGDGIGVNGTDILRFSIPIVCENGASLIDANGDVAYWGEPLTWGCTQSSCMDADNNCLTTDYKYSEYLVNSDNQLVRGVISPAFVLVREDVTAYNIIDFQVSASPDGNVVTLQVTAQKKSVVGATLTATSQVQVFLRNRP